MFNCVPTDLSFILLIVSSAARYFWFSACNHMKGSVAQNCKTASTQSLKESFDAALAPKLVEFKAKKGAMLAAMG